MVISEADEGRSGLESETESNPRCTCKAGALAWVPQLEPCPGQQGPVLSKPPLLQALGHTHKGMAGDSVLCLAINNRASFPSQSF